MKNLDLSPEEKKQLEEELEGNYIIIKKLYERKVAGESESKNRTVYLAEKDKVKYVIKESNSYDSEAQNEKQFFEIINKIQSKLLNKITLITKESKFLFISEYYNGGDLDEHLSQNYNDKPFEIIKIIHVMKNVILGLKFLFDESIIHQDIKKKNLVIKFYDDESYKEKNILKSNIIIIDYGSCKKKDCSEEIKGTIPYINPGVFKNNDSEVKFNEELDLWSLGVLCLKLFGGIIPDEEKNKGIKDKYYIPLNENTTIELVRFIDSLLQENPENQIKIEDLMSDTFINDEPNTFTNFSEEYSNGKIIEKNNKKYIELNINDKNKKRNFNYDYLLGKNNKIDKYINDCFFELNKNFLFTQPVLIPIIGIKEN